MRIRLLALAFGERAVRELQFDERDCKGRFELARIFVNIVEALNSLVEKCVGERFPDESLPVRFLLGLP